MLLLWKIPRNQVQKMIRTKKWKHDFIGIQLFLVADLLLLTVSIVEKWSVPKQFPIVTFLVVILFSEYCLFTTRY